MSLVFAVLCGMDESGPENALSTSNLEMIKKKNCHGIIGWRATMESQQEKEKTKVPSKRKIQGTFTEILNAFALLGVSF